MNQNTFLLLPVLALFFSLAFASASPALTPVGDHPNIIVIFTDDQGYGDLGCFGSKTIKTPHLDKMASEGLRLTSFYAQPVCGVSRAALMTGSYPIRIAEPGNIKRLHTVPHPEEWTMAEMFKEAGYSTALLGKWHLGLSSREHSSGFDPETMPNAQGFDYFFGTPLFNGFTTFVEDTKFRSKIFHNGDVVVNAVESWDSITRDYTREALDWIEKNRDRRFFLYLAHNLPHVPVGASPAFKGKSAYGPYGDTIEEIDWSCGQIFAKLKTSGLDEKTLVIFTSDNGPWIETTRGMKPGAPKFIPRDHSGSADPLRGWKMSAWDGGSRVPCIVRWPGRIPEGRTSDEILTTMDFLPTFAALAGAKIPDSLTLDGVDAKAFLLGQTEKSPKDEYFYYSGCLLTGVRAGEWKLVLPRSENPNGLGWWGRMIEKVPEAQLYHLGDDPGESKNVAAEHPEIVAALQKRIERARGDLGALDRTGTGARLFDEGPRLLQVGAGKAKKKPPATTAPHGDAEPVGDLRFTFEGGEMRGWTVIEGKLPDALTDRKGLPNHPAQPFNKEGRWFLYTGNRRDQAQGDDKLTGVLESPPFTLLGNRIRFLVGGGSGDSTRVALCDAEGKELMIARGNDSPVMRRVDWNAKDHSGKTLRIRIIDRSQGGWGHVTFDDFSCEGEIQAEVDRRR